jgi:pentalenolactone synthase
MTRAITRILTPAQTSAWHVVGHAEARALLSDDRIGMSHPDPAKAVWYTTDDVAGRPRGGSETEYLEHNAWRRTMNRVFSPRNLVRAAECAGTIAEELLDGIAGCEQPVDVNAAFSMPLCSRVMLQMLDIPTSALDAVQGWTDEGATTGDVDRSLGGMKGMLTFVTRLVRERRNGDGADVVSQLIRAGAASGSGSDTGKIVKLVAGMLAFGRETPASSVSFGILLLLTHPEQRARLVAEPGLWPTAVDEVLRLFHPPAATRHGLVRYAHEDVQVGGELIARGEMVLVDIARANLDERTFASAEEFDVTRQPNPHLTFGSGFYMCNFAKLARLELTSALTVLFARMPGLALADTPANLRYKNHLRTRAIESLPVTW